MRYTYSLNDLYFRKPEMSFEAWLEQNPHLEKGDFDPRNLYDGYAQEHEHQGFVVGGDHIRGLLIADPICIEAYVRQIQRRLPRSVLGGLVWLEGGLRRGLDGSP